jgi:hypothetical protein
LNIIMEPFPRFSLMHCYKHEHRLKRGLNNRIGTGIQFYHQLYVVEQLFHFSKLPEYQ